MTAPSPRTPPVRLVVGIPRRTGNLLVDTALGEGCSLLVSASSLWDPRVGRFRTFPRETCYLPVALDSAGFVAMKQGGYRWTPEQYVDFVALSTLEATEGELAFGWTWWASMDYCVEPQVAGSRREVRARIHKTADTLEYLLALVDDWRDEGISWLPDPLPILQGWTAEDYALSVRLTGEVLARTGRAWPTLVGVGSVCRRHLRGPAGLVAVLEGIREVLPETTWDEDREEELPVRLHLFGIKGAAVEEIDARWPGWIASVDSMAWDFRARILARERRVSCSLELRAAELQRWVRKATWRGRSARRRARQPSSSSSQ